MTVTIFGIFEELEIRWNGDINNPMWIAQDVCNILDIENVSDACRNIPDKDKGIDITDTLGGKQEMISVTEAGLYRLIFKSRKPEAERFQDWVFSDVLPTIRKTGTYQIYKTRSQIQLLLKQAQKEKLILLLEETKLKIQKLDMDIADLEESMKVTQLEFIDQKHTL
jgi:prophage antirepressor-like protein